GRLVSRSGQSRMMGHYGFFFSSRRRHTRWPRDWSSDVCSSDLSEVVLKNGLGTRYGLGVMVRQELGHRAIIHGGEVSGFTAENMVFPDDRVAVVVLTNQDSIDASGDIARKIAPLVFPQEDASQQEQQA